jgi:hypothetical protein
VSGVARAAGIAAGVIALGFATAATFGVGGVALGLTASKIGAIAGVVSAAANVASQMTAKPPPARGNVNDITIGANQPTPYLIGETYYGGSRLHWVGYGPTIKKVPNPYLFMADVYSACGPVEGLVGTYLDHVLVPFGSDNQATGYFSGHLWRYPQVGLDPEPAPLASRWGGVPGWDSSHKLSSFAAIGWSLLFDRDGKVFASGIAQTGAVWRGVKTYDARKDSSYPGGSGSHRIDDESTWEYSECPGQHALVYALGRYRQGRKVFGIGEPVDGIRIADFVALSNVCDANGWKVGGVIFEGANASRDQRWNNLKDICFAGGAKPGWVGGLLALDISAPRVALDRITEDDLADDDIEVGAMQGWEDRLNTLIPKYRSRNHKWEYVQSSPVQIANYLAEDGEEKGEERQFNLVQHKDQAAQLCAYELMDRRELGEIVIRCKPRLRKYGMGDLLILHLPEDGLVEQPCVVMRKGFHPVDMSVTFILRGETPGKHPFALGQTGTAPPTPALGGSAANDDIAGNLRTPSSVDQLLIANSYPVGISIISADAGGSATITVSNHTRVYQDLSVAVTGAEITSLLNSTTYYLFYDDPDRAGGAVEIGVTTNYADAFSGAAHPARHYVGAIATASTGGGDTGGGGGVPPGGGGTVNPNLVEP